jgi:hypothetical protein
MKIDSLTGVFFIEEKITKRLVPFGVGGHIR